MNALEIVFGIISIVLSALTLLAMVFAVRLGKKILVPNTTLYGEKAREQYEVLKTKILKGKTPETYLDEGGRKIIPQLKIEKVNYEKGVLPDSWAGVTRRFRFYDWNNAEPRKVIINEYRV
jgi:hypothetical protein